MTEKKNLNHKNIDNLTSLWKMAGIAFQSYYEEDDFNYCGIKNSEWPNKLWFNQKIRSTSLEKAVNRIRLNTENLVIPYWELHEDNAHDLFKSIGFVEKSKQTAMSLKLKHKFNKDHRLTFKVVTNAKECKIWSDLYPGAFGYRISEEILLKTHNIITYYLVYFNEQPVGTAILHQTGEIMGIHGVGIAPEMRRKGFAEEIMRFLLNRSIDLGTSYAVLQASAMGKGIYDKLGFDEQFLITNYTLNT